MDNNELLQAIRQVVKEEVSAQVEPINVRLDRLEQGQSKMQSYISVMKGDIKEIQDDIKELRSGQNYIIEWVDKIETTVKDMA